MEHLPLSDAQTGVWLAQKLAPEVPAYNVGGYVEIFGAVDRAVLELSISQVLQQTDSFRYRFVDTTAGPRQVMASATSINLPLLDFSTAGDPRAEAIAWMRSTTEARFDLAAGPLYRIALLKVAEDRYFCLGAFHHLVTDFFGIVQLLRHIAVRYTALLNQAVAPAPQFTPWPEILSEEDEYRASARYTRDREYWLEQLRDRPAAVTLSGQPPAWPSASIEHESSIPASTFQRLNELGTACKVGAVGVLFGALAVYLSRLSGQRDLLLGMPVSARTSPRQRASPGFMANVVPVRLQVEPGDRFTDVLRQVGTRLREAFRHQRYGAGALRADLGLAANEANIFGPELNFLPSDAPLAFGRHRARPHLFTNSRTVEDLRITVHAGEDGCSAMFQLSANASRYDERSLHTHERNILHLLAAIADRPELPAGLLRFMRDEDRERLLTMSAPLEAGQPVSIAMPVRGSRVYVLDTALEPAPIGVPGEVYIAGLGVGRGSLSRPGLTAERFVADPYGKPGSRMYRSGNLARWHENGTLEYLGRADQQLRARAMRTPAAPPSDYEPPQTQTEIQLAVLWCQVLRCERVGRADNFFHLGGHSLLALQVVARVRESFGVELPLKAMFDGPTLRLSALVLDELLDLGARRTLAPILPTTAEGPAPLSHSQERMWLIQSINRQTTAYNMAAALWLRGSVDTDALSRSVDDLLARHEVLRSRIQVINDRPTQIVDPPASSTLRMVDLRDHPDADTEAVRRVEAEQRRVFDLEKDPAVRAGLLQTAPDRFLFFFVIHHAASDQWSAGVFGRELAVLYTRRLRGESGQLAPLPISYRDFSRWQRSSESTAQFERQLQYWVRRLAGLAPVELPIDHARPKVWTLNGASLQRQIPPQLFGAVVRFARDNGATLFMTLYAGFAVLLHRLSGQTDLSIGVPVANRSHSALEGMMGTFVNTLVLRSDLQGDPEFLTLLDQVRRNSLEAFENQDVSFDRLVQQLGQSGDRSRAPLTQVLFNVINAPMNGIEFEGLEWEPLHLNRVGAQFELSFSVDTEITRQLGVEYNTDLFERATIERLMDQYFTILEAVVRAPRTRLSRLSLLSRAQWAQICTWNHTSMALPGAETLPRMFAAQVARRSADDCAVSFEGTQLSYAQLDARSSELARRLRSAGVGRGSKVGVFMNRSPLVVISLLAVQKSGGAYVPLDPDFPAERLTYMVNDSGASVLLTSGPAPEDLKLPEGVIVLDSGAQGVEPDNGPADPVTEGPLPEDIVYVLYTSGSTGRPKGVGITHGALANFLASMRHRPGLDASDVLAAVTTISFDIAGLELYLPLIAGARIELVSRAVATDARALAELLNASGATLLQATPATWRLLMETNWRPQRKFRALCGGEALSRTLADEILERVDELWNMYGPTETTIWSTLDQVERDAAPISIGSPIGNTQVHILDAAGEPVPIGVVGEICIGGAGVAQGYLKRPALTAERFVPDPFGAVPGRRLYRTGDLGRWGQNGKLYHLGRLDLQTKIRGYRIELGEIEAVLNSHPAIQSAIAAVRDARVDDPRLVAFVRYREGQDPTVSDLKRDLRTRLPDYMVPSIIVPVAAMPLTPNGKVDRAALPDPFAAAPVEAALHEPPATQMEKVIAEIWKSVLKVDRVSAADNFFELGGYSLLSLRVAKLVERNAGRPMDPRALFFQNLREIAASLEPQYSSARAKAR